MIPCETCEHLYKRNAVIWYCPVTHQFIVPPRLAGGGWDRLAVCFAYAPDEVVVAAL